MRLPAPLLELGHPALSSPGPPHEARAHDPRRVSGIFLLPDSRGSPLCHRLLHNPLLLPEQVWSIPHPRLGSPSPKRAPPPPPTPLTTFHTGSGLSALPNHRCSLVSTPL